MEMVPQKDCASGRMGEETGFAGGANAKRKAETLREMQSTLKAEEKELRKILNKELASLELDLCVLSKKIEW